MTFLSKIKLLTKCIFVNLYNFPKYGTIFANYIIKVRRYNVCLKCENFIKNNETCKICGCKIIYKIEPRYSPCPLGKWDHIK